MKRLTFAISLALAGWSGVGIAAHPSFAASLCVGSGPGCYPALQQALTVAHNGDVIRVGAGTFAGGVSITKSVQIIGAGAGVTTIQGGGPVMTIGSPDTTSQPTVSINGMTITGGLNTTIPYPSQPRGGGIWVPPAADGGPGSGATVTITDSAITGNRVKATEPGDCGPGCTFAISRGGGMDSFGTMTLNNTVVSGNQAVFDLTPAPGFAGAYGGGIKNNGTLTVRNSTVSGNTARFTTATPNQNDRSAQGGGIDSNGPLTMDATTVSDNAVTMISTSTDPTSGVFGVGAGVDIEENGGTGTIRDSVISGNSISATGYTGGNGDGGAGIDADGPLLLVDSVVRENQATTSETAPVPGLANGAGGAGIETDSPATIRGTTISDNRAATMGNASVAFAMGAALSNGIGQTVTLSDSRITGNTATAATTSGAVYVEGGAIHNDAGTMMLRNTAVSDNSGSASGSTGLAQGGGIFNGSATFFCPGCGPSSPPQLILSGSTITQNSLTASSPNVTVQGGGVYDDTSQQATVTVNDTVIARNVPDQCSGC